MKYIYTMIAILLPTIALGQDFKFLSEQAENGKSVNVQQVEYTVSPQKVKEPALDYKLTWSYADKTKENAAIHYNFACREMLNLEYILLKGETNKYETKIEHILSDSEMYEDEKAKYEAFEKMLAEIPEDAKKSSYQIRQEGTAAHKSAAYAHYVSLPKAEFPMEDAKKFVSGYSPIYRRLETASKCDHCDFDHKIRNNRDFIALLLPEVQEMRGLARWLAVKAKIEIYEGRFDDAVKTIRLGLEMSNHMVEEPILVTQLVGIAIRSIMFSCLIELAQEPNAPNLYWALTDIDSLTPAYKGAIECEMNIIPWMMPTFGKAVNDTEKMTDNDWRMMNDEFSKIVPYITDSFGNINSDGFAIANIAISLTAYPNAVQRLLEQGITREEIDAMPVATVIGKYSVARFKTQRDEVLKQANLPIWQTEAPSDTPFIDGRVTPTDILVSLLFPAVNAAKGAYARTDFSLDAMRITEAIRDYAADHDGKLPEKLSDITSLPIPPISPFSGTPYSYKIQDGAAVIESEQHHNYHGYYHSFYRVIIRLK